jgi:hypothetical protein
MNFPAARRLAFTHHDTSAADLSANGRILAG